MFDGDLTAAQRQELLQATSLDVPWSLAAGCWTKSEFRILLAAIAFGNVGHRPDREDLAALTGLSKTATAAAVARLCRAQPNASHWLGAVDADRVPARRRNGSRRAGRRRQLYALRKGSASDTPHALRNGSPTDTPLIILPAASVRVDLGTWARRVLVVLGSGIRQADITTNTGTVTVELVEAEARARLLQVAGRLPRPREACAAWKELLNKGLVVAYRERGTRRDPTTGTLQIYRRVQLRHRPLQWSETARGPHAGTADDATCAKDAMASSRQ